MKDRIIVLSASPYVITDDKDGSINSGVSMFYMFGTDLTPQVSDDGKFFGYRVAKGSVLMDQRANLKQVPGVYDCDFIVKNGQNGMPQLKPSVLSFVAPLK